MRKIDQWLIARGERAYLWVFDVTGVYVGTLMVVLGGALVGLYVARGNPFGWGDGFFLLLTMVVAGLMYSQQASGTVEEYNASVEFQRTFAYYPRWFMNYTIVVFTLVAIVKMDAAMMLQEALWLVYTYTVTTKIRERRPQEQWEEAKNEC